VAGLLRRCWLRLTGRHILADREAVARAEKDLREARQRRARSEQVTARLSRLRKSR
jgi:hypothetical protein